MSGTDQAIVYRPFRAPREDGGTLIEPPLAAVPALIDRNRELASGQNISLQGRSLTALAAEAREQLLLEALRYTRAYRDVPDLPDDAAASRPIFLAGHQPQLFHPGVWYKNFVLSALARRHGAVAVNLTIDSDTIKTAAMRVPCGTAANPRVEAVEFDASGPEIPYEERTIIDRSRLESFGRRAGELIRTFVPDPLLDEFWPLVVGRSRECANLGACVAQARHQQEDRYGATTLELPQSSICSLAAFHWFAAWLLANLPRVHQQYNAAVTEYRRVHHIRSAAHPVPELAADGQWLEAPLWIWRRDDPRRRRVFARHGAGRVTLTDRHGLEIPLCLSPDADAACAADQLSSLSGRGVRLRTRALVTTLFARVLLGDLFLHGIGGAKYDQVTDALIGRLLSVEPPAYMTVTATLRLPIEWSAAPRDAARAIDQQLREFTFHPERFLAGENSAPARELARVKGHWIDVVPTRQNARERCREIRRANERLQPWVADQRERLLAARGDARDALEAERILGSREYAFCLYPQSALRRLLAV